MLFYFALLLFRFFICPHVIIPPASYSHLDASLDTTELDPVSTSEEPRGKWLLEDPWAPWWCCWQDDEAWCWWSSQRMIRVMLSQLFRPKRETILVQQMSRISSHSSDNTMVSCKRGLQRILTDLLNYKSHNLECQVLYVAMDFKWLCR